MPTRKITLVIIILSSLIVISVAAAVTTPSIDWAVMGSGGGRSQSASGHVTINSTIGQPFSGVANVDAVETCAGFWCPNLNSQTWKIYLPLVFH